ncbi:preprotein translocase subunit SecY [Infirmifilum lucidum]|uniref:Protein translocase subunit SecY n=1 Tax=Infirmifilum lucidum TaxID=2776706 RepID=A0A7L9FF86_9CREN|nr:preprotein translocase subunit SecY [Infirmifilum lucidum]QOJ78389.1 preprotein translocase subunit SecY [Infirmifilum lucidum]
MSVYDRLSVLFRILPEVERPSRKPSLGERLFWTGLVLIAYFLMGQVPLYGIPRQTQGTIGALEFLRIVMASKRGTLIELGIGPIVTSGIIWELLVGSKIVNIDLTSREGRRTFAGLQKLTAILFAALEAFAYIYGGVYGFLTPTQQALVFIQLFVASIFVILMNDMLEKGWGVGSAVSLFIAAGVAQQIFWELFSPIGPLADGLYYGLFPSLIVGVVNFVTTGNATLLHYAILRPTGYPDLVGFASMVALLLFLAYLESTKVTIPVSSARFSGMRTRIPLKLLYVSVMPVILVGALYANIVMITQALWPRLNPGNTNPYLNVIAKFNYTQNGPVPLPGSLVYYITPPRSIFSVFYDPVHVAVYALLYISFAVLFGVAWIVTSGMDPESQAEQLVKAQLHIPGFRKSEKIIANVLRRYIWSLTILSSILIGLIAVTSDLLRVMGGGTGILLLVGITIQYYSILASERALEMYPALSRLLGE